MSSMMGDAVQTTRTESFGADFAAVTRKGRSSCVRKKGAIALVPIITSYPCFVFAPSGAAPIPALLNRTSSLVSCSANVLTAGLTVVKSVRSRWMYFISPDDLRTSDLIEAMASRALDSERESM